MRLFIAIPLSDEMKKYGKNIMIVYGGGSVKRNGILDEVRKTLEECGKTVFEFGGVASSPSYEKILEGIAMYKKENIDLMIALGGGSVVDSTKIMAAGAEIEGDIWDEEMIRHNIPEKMGKYAVVLTISGAGAEMDHLGACTNEKTHEKKTFVGPYADFVIEDPAYVMSVPLHTFTPGVFDSLSHCMETCFGQGTNVWDEINESLMKNIIRNGKALMKDPDNMEIRSNLMWDSSLIQSFSFYTGKPMALKTCWQLIPMRRTDASWQSCSRSIMTILLKLVLKCLPALRSMSWKLIRKEKHSLKPRRKALRNCVNL